jgi:hypothetical protein
MKHTKWMAVVGLAGLGFLGQAWAEISVGGGVALPSKPAAAAPAVDGKTTSGDTATETEDTLGFLNKDKLHGNLLAVTPGGYGLKWKHGNVDKTIGFGLASVANVKLAPRKLTKGVSSSAIYLTNGDMLPGNIVSLDGEKLVLDPWYAGTLSVNRLMVKSISPNTGLLGLVYEGPNNLTEWTTPQPSGIPGSWKFKNGALLASQNQLIGRDIEGMPDMADIQFDVGWRAYPAFSFMFYADSTQEPRCNGYVFQVSGSTIYLQRCFRDSGLQSVGESYNYQPLTSGGKQARFNLLVDKKKKSIVLCIGGHVVKQWTDSTVLASQGKAISFRAGNNGDLKISRIRIGVWDGKAPDAKVADASRTTKEDLIRFVNSDKVSGQLKSIADGNAKFETSYATLDIPLVRVVEIVSASENSERARKNNEDIRSFFFDKGQVTLQLTQIEKDDIKGKSENFGEISMPLGAMQLLEFNIYEDRQAEEDEYGASGEAPSVE